MSEKEIKKIVKKFERIMGPVASRVAEETAERMKILKGNKISPANAEEEKKFLKMLSDEYSKLIGRKVTDTIIKL